MRIDSPAPHATHAPRQRAAAATDTTTTPAPAPAPTTPRSADAATKGRGAEHRSDVATLRQWVNHPDRRDAMTLPDVNATDHRGQGFAKAVEAYRAVLAELPAPPAAPPVTDPVTDPVTVIVPPPAAPPVTDTVPVTDTAAEPDAPVVPEVVVPEVVVTG